MPCNKRRAFEKGCKFSNVKAFFENPQKELQNFGEIDLWTNVGKQKQKHFASRCHRENRGQFHQHFICAFAPIFFRRKKIKPKM
jgi:hypothetical protein